MSDGVPERTGEPEIATTTLAEIYAQQGLTDRALAIYRRLAERSPGDERLAERVVALEHEIERQRTAVATPPETAPAAPPETTPEAAGPRPSVSPASEDAEFLAWLARR